jgi:hypothetical protein
MLKNERGSLDGLDIIAILLMLILLFGVSLVIASTWS